MLDPEQAEDGAPFGVGGDRRDHEVLGQSVEREHHERDREKEDPPPRQPAGVSVNQTFSPSIVTSFGSRPAGMPRTSAIDRVSDFT